MIKMVPYFDPQTNKYPYPEYTDKHYLSVKKDNGEVFDENYRYIDKRWYVRFLNTLVYCVVFIVVFPLTRIRMGLRIRGKQNLKKHKALIKKGVISCCNHVHMWDYLCIMNAIKPKRPRILVWDKNIRGENGGLIRNVGGIPIPTESLKGTIKCFQTIKDYLNGGGWLHIYPEGSMWEYYAPIRPLKKGAAYFAIEYNKPIIPLAFSYRKPGWFRSKVLHQIATFTLNIGEPIFPNRELDRKAMEIDLTKRVHDAMVKLAGRDVKHKLYPEIFDNSKRVDYYTTNYGVGYKGSY